MKSTATPNCSPRACAAHLMLVAVLAIAPRAFSQTAPSPATAEQLAKYDKNKNGALDAEELRALQAGGSTARTPVEKEAATPVEDETISLSPFEVITDKDDDCMGVNAGTATKLGLDLKDLAAPYSVITKEFIEALNLTSNPPRSDERARSPPLQACCSTTANQAYRDA